MSFYMAVPVAFLFLTFFHILREERMLRVAREVRIFPLLTLDGVPSSHLRIVIESLSGNGYCAEIKRVPYEFQRGGDEMLTIKPG